jgi:sugar phosphate isomerase/epimerase
MSLQHVSAIVVAAISLCILGSSVSAENSIPAEFKQGGFYIGCQAWTWNNFTVMEAIEKTYRAGGKVIEFFPGQTVSKEDPNVKLNENCSAETINKVKAQLDKFHIKAVNFGVTGISRDAGAARKLFDFAKALGLRAITTESVDAIDTFEPLVKEYDIMVAFHDHPKQPNNPSYKMWDPEYILSVVKNRDRRIGSCADIGHWVRSGIKPVDALRILRGHIISSHLKDLNEFSPDGHDVPAGTGVSDIPAVLDELHAMGFTGNISIEYEYHMEDSLPEVSQSIGYVRGYGQAKKWQ